MVAQLKRRKKFRQPLQQRATTAKMQIANTVALEVC